MHLIKLVVGLKSLHDFAAWQQQEQVAYKGQAANITMTRRMPRQAAEMLQSGGSLYRVIRGIISCRQPIIGFEMADTLYGPKCLIYTSTEIIRTEPKPKKAFQGWRYLKPEDAPKDVAPYDANDNLPPPEMAKELAELGLL